MPILDFGSGLNKKSRQVDVTASIYCPTKTSIREGREHYELPYLRYGFKLCGYHAGLKEPSRLNAPFKRLSNPLCLSLQDSRGLTTELERGRLANLLYILFGAGGSFKQWLGAHDGVLFSSSNHEATWTLSGLDRSVGPTKKSTLVAPVGNRYSLYGGWVGSKHRS